MSWGDTLSWLSITSGHDSNCADQVAPASHGCGRIGLLLGNAGEDALNHQISPYTYAVDPQLITRWGSSDLLTPRMAELVGVATPAAGSRGLKVAKVGKPHATLEARTSDRGRPRRPRK